MRAIDLFAGFGGTSLGAHMAGVSVVWAANHCPVAVRVHEANHPNAEHVCQDLRQADWGNLPTYDLLLASPACQGHSTASQPRRRGFHDAMRATAWAVIDCAEVTSPRAIAVENVLEFARWQLYPLWLEALRKLGYRTTEHRLSATSHGVPQKRERLFITAVRRRKPPVTAIAGNTVLEPAIGPLLDDSAPGWKPWRSMSSGVQERIRRGQSRCGRRFLTQHVTGHSGVPLHEPIRTITTKDHWGLVDGDMYRSLTVREYARAMGFPDSYAWPDDIGRTRAIQGLGNAVPPPMARDVVAALAEAA